MIVVATDPLLLLLRPSPCVLLFDVRSLVLAALLEHL